MDQRLRRQPGHARRYGVRRQLARPGIPAERIVYLGEEHNWWTLGPEGPCGPDTEVFVDTTGAACQRGDAGCLPGTCDCGRFVEVWNNVFMTFQRRGGQLLPLPQANVDTGMGLEGMLTVLKGPRRTDRCVVQTVSYKPPGRLAQARAARAPATRTNALPASVWR
jgi:alanyl-tRNA synthetase